MCKWDQTTKQMLVERWKAHETPSLGNIRAIVYTHSGGHARGYYHSSTSAVRMTLLSPKVFPTAWS